MVVSTEFGPYPWTHFSYFQSSTLRTFHGNYSHPFHSADMTSMKKSPLYQQNSTWSVENIFILLDNDFKTDWKLSLNISCHRRELINMIQRCSAHCNPKESFHLDPEAKYSKIKLYKRRTNVIRNYETIISSLTGCIYTVYPSYTEHAELPRSCPSLGNSRNKL